MKTFLTLILLLFCATPILAQTASVKGKVVDDKNNPLPLVTVLLYTEGSGQPSAGTSTDDDGLFLLNNLVAGNYTLEFSYIGYQSITNSVLISETLDLGIITLAEAPEALGETVVEVRRPTIQKEPGKLIFNVENTSLSTGNTFDLLTKTPGVIVIQDQVTIKSKPTLIFINGKRVYLSATEAASLLKNVDASIIKSVEVISNPSANYDAEAGAVLNIITSRAISVGYKGVINGRYEQAVYPKYSIGTSHFYKNDWVNFYTGYSFNPKKEYKDQFDEIVFYEPSGDIKSIWNTDFTRTTKSYVHQGNLIADFSINEKNTLSFSSNIFVSPNKQFTNTVAAEIANAQQQLDSTFLTNSDLKNNQYNLAFTGEYKTILDEKGSSLAATANYILYDEDQNQDVITNYFLPNGDFIRESSFFTKSLQQSNILTTGLDLNIPLESSTIDAGVKYSNIDTQSGLDYFNTVNNSMQFNPALSDSFDYEESIYAAYFNFSKEWTKWQFTLGLRTEFTKVNGDSQSLGIVNTQEYLDWFPAGSLQYHINDFNSIGLSYARHIQRPRYQSLNPFKYFLNENNFNGGNPNLVPAIDEKITLSYSHKSKWFFDLYYQQTKDALSLLRFQDNEAQILRTEDANLIKEFQYSLDIVHVSSLTSWWYMSLYTSGFYFENEFYAMESVEETYVNSTYGVYGQIYNGLTITKDRSWSGDITATYLSDFIYASHDYGNQFSLSFSIRKSFWNNTASITAGINDVLDTYNVPVVSKYYNQNNSYFAQPESRLYRVSFKYTFGNASLRDNNRDNKPVETERLEKKDP
ncbi:outer membrane receptor protein involved in Fe transport [Ulvibacter sp. MAR_2010_11]|uniref:TonB-dependent receptor domain-containing protein n=1 Tax=Ulvibacter sp. MAR_2010_11 TaxID=1250229 RepID=UPI000C2C7DBE|nr:TonB-dependent receptor [Ulvibacter sp. MAR_2010_11]PKA82963.1 outer membrane receptor protein involved in Fe transport [Ulvibacter sp. MAR_2010_11]